MKFAVIAAGEGSRLNQEGVALPKPLVRLNGEPMIDRLLRIFAENDISIETMVQRGSAPGEESTEIVILTHSAVEGRVRRAIAAIEALDHVHGRVVMLRKEEMN